MIGRVSGCSRIEGNCCGCDRSPESMPIGHRSLSSGPSFTANVLNANVLNGSPEGGGPWDGLLVSSSCRSHSSFCGNEDRCLSSRKVPLRAFVRCESLIACVEFKSSSDLLSGETPCEGFTLLSPSRMTVTSSRWLPTALSCGGSCRCWSPFLTPVRVAWVSFSVGGL